jgi:hypothetical protein
MATLTVTDEVETNVTLGVRQADGTFTNISVRARVRRENDNTIITFPPPYKRKIVIPTNIYYEGDFWLPGEFERALEEKKLERKRERE